MSQELPVGELEHLRQENARLKAEAVSKRKKSGWPKGKKRGKAKAKAGKTKKSAKAKKKTPSGRFAE